jgi:NAD(P)-dependent dehydrogenase (short-subunit alcohol dehydrogenase family)
MEDCVTDSYFLRHKGMSAVITGGTQGLGLAIAKRLAHEVAKNIALAGRNEERATTAVAEIKDLGAHCIFIRTDITNAADCTDLVKKSISEFGAINALVNSAGCTSRGTLLDTSLDLWEEHFNTNVRGPFLTMQALVEHLVHSGAPGSIVNVLSVGAHCGPSFLTAYSASKGALATLTKNVANAYRKNRIRCNGVQPGWMDTPGESETQKRFHGAGDDWLARAEAQMPMGQLVKTEHLASLVSYMLSAESGVMTGALVDFDQTVIGAYPE